MTRIFVWLLSLLWLLPLAAPQWCMAMPVQRFFPAPDLPACPIYGPDPVRTPDVISGAETNAPCLTAEYNLPGEQPLWTGILGDEFRYTGEQWDPNAGFHYLRARWMEPRVGRFVSVDRHRGRAEAPLTLHRYAYASTSPASYADPSGHSAVLAVYSVTVATDAGLASMALPNVTTGAAEFEVEVVEYGTKQDWWPNPYQAFMFVRNGARAVTVAGSSWPNPYLPDHPDERYHIDYPGIAEGEYPATYRETGHHGESPAIELDGNIPTIYENPGHDGAMFADEIEIHEGYSATWRGSTNCMTIKHGQGVDVWQILTPDQRGTVKLIRRVVSGWGETG